MTHELLTQQVNWLSLVESTSGQKQQPHPTLQEWSTHEGDPHAHLHARFHVAIALHTLAAHAARTTVLVLFILTSNNLGSAETCQTE